ncbi:DUF3558 domain-containing protein [Actinocrispum wychmicini]|nr:DUF3558 domain-containing protein [Actinocrispum wychmicini]
MHAQRIAGTFAIFALVVAGCSGTPQGSPPTSAGSASSRTPLPSSAPSVPKSWDAKQYRDKPCTLFTDQQARVLGYLKPGHAYFGQPDAATCTRDSDEHFGDFTIKYYFATDVLGKIYRREITWPTNSTLQITVVDQPGVRTDFPEDVECRVVVGLTDTQGFEVRVLSKNSCERAVNVAETIMHNVIKG